MPEQSDAADAAPRFAWATALVSGQYANVLLPGLYAWLTTVAYPATNAPHRGAASIASIAALVSLVLGPVFRATEPGRARLVGVILYLACCAVTWLLTGPALAMERVEPVRAALGGVAWALFAFGWGAVRKPGDVPENNPRAVVDEVLTARRSLPTGAYVVFAVAIAASLVPIFLAWRVLRTEHALFAHAAAIACAIALVTAGARIAVGRGQWRPRGTPAQRLNRAALPLTIVALLAFIGVINLLVS